MKKYWLWAEIGYDGAYVPGDIFLDEDGRDTNGMKQADPMGSGMLKIESAYITVVSID